MALITVFTPTYNRAHLLHKCYESLCKQSCKDFVWLVIDDGSIDNTKMVVEGWQKGQKEFEIKYIFKENEGMHTAHNTAYANIETELNVCIDSDDYLTDEAIERIKDCWLDNRDEKYAGIIALDIFNSGEIVGSSLPCDRKSIGITSYYTNGGTGDKKLIYRTEIMKKLPPYPVFEGEKYVGLSYKYTLADQQYTLIILNFPVCVVEYMEDGSSKNMFKQYLMNPKGFAFLRRVNMIYHPSQMRQYIECIHYVSSSMICRNKRFVKESPRKMMTVFALIPGCLLTIYVRRKVKK